MTLTVISAATSMKCGIYLTCNNMPDFGEEHENVLNRLDVYETTALPKKEVIAANWIEQHAAQCLLWVVNQINENIHFLNDEDLYYQSNPTSGLSDFVWKNVFIFAYLDEYYSLPHLFFDISLQFSNFGKYTLNMKYRRFEKKLILKYNLKIDLETFSPW